MTASTTIATDAGEEVLRVQVDDGDPYVVLTVGRHAVALTRDESRRAADALRAGSLRSPYRP